MAETYAESLLLVCKGSHEVDRMVDELEGFTHLTREHPALASAWRNPRIPSAQKLKVAAALTPGYSETFHRFLAVVLRRGRGLELDAIAGAYRRKARALQGVLDGEVRTAVALTDAEHARIEAAMTRSFGQKVRLVRRVDPRLIGGVRVRVGDRLLDRSLSSALERLGERLTQTALGEVDGGDEPTA